MRNLLLSGLWIVILASAVLGANYFDDFDSTNPLGFSTTGDTSIDRSLTEMVWLNATSTTTSYANLSILAPTTSLQFQGNFSITGMDEGSDGGVVFGIFENAPTWTTASMPGTNGYWMLYDGTSVYLRKRNSSTTDSPAGFAITNAVTYYINFSINSTDARLVLSTSPSMSSPVLDVNVSDGGVNTSALDWTEIAVHGIDLGYNNDHTIRFDNYNLTTDSTSQNISISLSNPGNGVSTTVQQTAFQFTPVFNYANQDTCILYTNSSGSWAINGTNASIINNTLTTFNLFLSRGIYKWNVWCNDSSSNNASVATNYTFSITGGTIKLNSTSVLTGSAINTFSIYVNGSLNGSTTNGTFYLEELDNADYYIGFTSSGFANHNTNITLQNASQFYQAGMYTQNSFNITIREEVNNTIVTGRTTQITFIANNNNYTYTTNNGTLYVDLLTPADYVIRYKITNDTSYGNRLRSYLVTLQNNTQTELTLYVIPQPDGNTTVASYDQSSLAPLKDAVVYLQRRFIDNTYKTVAMAETDQNGQSFFEVDFSTEYYKMVVDYPWQTQKLVTDRFYIESTLVTLYVPTSTPIGEDFFNIQRISTTLSYNNATNEFQATYSDPAQTASQFCLYTKRYVQYGEQILNTSCSSSSSGSLTTGSLIENKTYFGVLTVSIGNDETILKTVWEERVPDTLESGSLGLYLTVGLVMTFALLASVHYIALLLATAALVFAKILGLLTISWPTVMIPFIVGLILIILLEARK